MPRLYSKQQLDLTDYKVHDYSSPHEKQNFPNANYHEEIVLRLYVFIKRINHNGIFIYATAGR